MKLKLIDEFLLLFLLLSIFFNLKTSKKKFDKKNAEAKKNFPHFTIAILLHM